MLVNHFGLSVFSSKKKAPKRITMETADSVIVVNQTFYVV